MVDMQATFGIKDVTVSSLKKTKGDTVASLIELKIEDDMVSSLEKSKLARYRPQFHYPDNATIDINAQNFVCTAFIMVYRPR